MMARKKPMPGSRRRVIYCSISAQHDNLGDIEIRSVFIDWLLETGHPVVVFVGSMPRGYIDAFHLPESARQVGSRSRFQLSLLRDAARGRASLAFAPGPQSFGPALRSIGKTLINLINASLVKATGGAVVGAGRALRGRGAFARALERSFIRRFDVYTVRDVLSSGQVAMTLEAAPDLAFAHVGVASSSKNTVLISLRSDRTVNVELLEQVIDRARGAGFDVLFVTQVKRDDQQHAALANRLGVRAVLWGERSHDEQLRVLRETYSSAGFVVSNRLHALILGIQHLAAPVAVLDPGVDKLSATIPPWIEMCSLSSGSDDVAPFEALLHAATAGGGGDRLASERDAARARLDGLRGRLSAAVAGAHSSTQGRSSGGSRRRVAITQPYVPAYRVPLWESVIGKLAGEKVECRIFYGGDREQELARSQRGDGALASWATRVRTRTFQLFGRGPKLVFRFLPTGWRGRRVLLVTEMQASNLNAWLAVVSRRPLITLGHGVSGTTDGSRAASVLENRLNRSADRVLTYSEAGRRHVIASTRLDPSRVVTFRNTTDTTALDHAIRAVTSEQQSAFRREHGIPENARIALCLGALSRYKKIDLLVDAGRKVLHGGVDWLVVAGDGEEAWKLRSLAEETGRVVMLGHASPADFAPAATLASLLLNPGRVGLIAVDALAMGLPILTTLTSERAPEFEYLRLGEDVVEVDPTPEAYAAGWSKGIEKAGDSALDMPTIDAAAGAITASILAQLSDEKEDVG